MLLYFDKLVISGFKVFKSKQVLNMRRLGLGLHFMCGQNLDHPLGSNGAGKSTVWDAMLWCLTGRTVQGLRTGDVKPWRSKKVLPHVKLYIARGPDDDSLEKHVIERKGVSNGLRLDGKVVAQEDVDELLGLSAFNIPHTLILGQARPLFFDLKPQAKLELLGKTLNVDKWEERSVAARGRHKELQNEFALVSAALEEAEKQVEEYKVLFEKLKHQSDEWHVEQSNKTLELNKAIKQETKQHKTLQRKMDGADLKYEHNEVELRHLQATYKDINTKESTARAVVVRASSSLKVAEFKLNKVIADKVKTNCPTCGQPLQKHKLTDLKAAYKAALKVAQDEVDLWEGKLKKAKVVLREASAAVAAHEQHMAQFSETSNNKRDEYLRLQKRVAELEASLKAKQQQVEHLEQEQNPYASLIADARMKRRSLKAVLSKHEYNVKRLEAEVEHTKYWVEGFKQVRLYLLEEALRELETVTQSMLATLGLEGWRVEYSIEREGKQGQVINGLSVMIYEPGHESGVKWESWSGGEGQRLRVIGALALSEVLLRRAGVQCDLIVLDEPSRHMSAEGVSGLVDCLVERGREFQIFYVDHQTVDDNRFASLIKVRREGGHAAISVQ